MISRKIFFFLCYILSAQSSFAALPFVTDDAAIVDVNQVSLEAFTEYWHLPKKGDQELGNLSGAYLSASYGVAKNLELTLGGLTGYNYHNSNINFGNPILQAKTMAYLSKKDLRIPNIAISAGYADRHGRDQYFDAATNGYLLGIATSKFFDSNLIIHVNSGVKSSYNIDTQQNFSRLHLGVAADIALFSPNVRFIAESYNGAPNSPRDSPDFFRSYQTGFRLIKSSSLSFHILYGSQPTFVGYDVNNNMFYRRTNWAQVGIRKIIDDLF